MMKNWGWVGQYVIAITVSLLLGAILSSLPLFTASVISGTKLKASDMVQFMGYSGALLLLWLLGQRAAAALPEDGKGLAFMRHIIMPLVTLIVVCFGYNVILILAAPFLTKAGKAIFNWIFVVGIVSSAVWLAVASLLHSARLMAWFETVGRVGTKPVSPSAVHCRQCGRAVAADMQFCGGCGKSVAYGQVTPETAAQRS